MCSVRGDSMIATLHVRAGLTDRKEYIFGQGETYLVGRSREADIIVKDKLASRASWLWTRLPERRSTPRKTTQAAC